MSNMYKVNAKLKKHIREKQQVKVNVKLKVKVKVNINVKLKIPVKIKIWVRGKIHVNENAKILGIGKQHVMVKVSLKLFVFQIYTHNGSCDS